MNFFLRIVLSQDFYYRIEVTCEQYTVHETNILKEL